MIAFREMDKYWQMEIMGGMLAVQVLLLWEVMMVPEEEVQEEQ